MSQAELAAAAGLSVNTIGAVERGGSYREATLDDVALVLGWPPGATGAFLRGNDDAIPEAGSLSGHLTKRRNALGLSQAEAARLAGVTRMTWYEWEKGRRQPQDSNYAGIDAALRWVSGTVEAILSGDGPGPVEPVRPAGSEAAMAAVSAARQKIIHASADELVEMRELVEEMQGSAAANEWLRKALRLRESVREAESPVRRQDAG